MKTPSIAELAAVTAVGIGLAMATGTGFLAAPRKDDGPKVEPALVLEERPDVVVQEVVGRRLTSQNVSRGRQR